MFISGMPLAAAGEQPPEWRFIFDGSPDAVVHAIDISADGNYIAAIYSDETVFLFDMGGPEPLWEYHIDEQFGGVGNDVVISADGEYVVTNTDSGIHFFHRNNSEPLWSYTNQSKMFSGIAISGNGAYLVAGGLDGNIYFFEKESSTPLWNFSTGAGVNNVDLSASGDYVVASALDGNIYLLQKDSADPAWAYNLTHEGSWNREKNPVSDISISADGSYIGTALQGDGSAYPNKLFLFSRDNGTPLWNHTLPSEVDEVEISNNGDYLATATVTLLPNYQKRGELHLFQKQSSTPVRVWDLGIHDYANYIRPALSGNGEFLAVSYWEGIALYQRNGDAPIWQGSDIFGRTAISEDGEYIVVGSFSYDHPGIYLFRKALDSDNEEDNIPWLDAPILGLIMVGVTKLRRRKTGITSTRR